MTGQKIFILGASLTKHLIVSAKPATSNATNGIRFFIVDLNQERLFPQKYRLTDGSVAMDLDLKDVKAELMPGTFDDFEGAAAKIKIAACAESIGIMERLFEDTLEYVKTREQFGRPLGKFQVIQHRLADKFTALELSRSHLQRMIDSDPTSASGRNQISGSRAFISKASSELAEKAVQLHGGMGITDELIIGRGLKRLLVLSTMFGDSAQELEQFS